MPDDRKLFAVTQWVLRAGIIVTTLLIGFYTVGIVVLSLVLATSRLPLDRIAHFTGVMMTADEIGRIALASFAGAIVALKKASHSCLACSSQDSSGGLM